MIDIQKIDELFKAWQGDDSGDAICPGGQVQVRHNDETVYRKCFGYSDLERDVLIDENTIFHVASVSKQITSMCILLLEEDGKLSCDDDVRKYIPELIGFEEPVTLTDMMNNISGIRDQWELQEYSGTLMIDEITQEHLQYINSLQKSLNFPPRSRNLYSNTNFSMLAEIVAKVSGVSFNEFASERIFKPLGMDNTLFREKSTQMIKNRALSYGEYQVNEEKRYRLSPVNYSNYGATSLHTNTSDFLKWMTTYRNPVICKPATLEKMLTTATLSTGEKITYACGIGVTDFHGTRSIQHGGADGGYRSHILCLPDEKIDVVIFSNVPNVNIPGAAEKIAKMLMNIEENIPESKPEEQKQDKKKPEPIPFTEAELKAYSGTYYSSEVETFYKVYEKDGKLFIRHRRRGDSEIIKMCNGESESEKIVIPAFYHKHIEFIKDEASDTADEMCFYGGRVLEFKFKRIDLSGY